MSLLSNIASSLPSNLKLLTTSISIINNNNTRSVFFGRNENASDSLDIGLDLLWSPPDSGVQVYFLSNGLTRFVTDFRKYDAANLQWSLNISTAVFLPMQCAAKYRGRVHA